MPRSLVDCADELAYLSKGGLAHRPDRAMTPSTDSTAILKYPITGDRTLRSSQCLQLSPQAFHKAAM